MNDDDEDEELIITDFGLMTRARIRREGIYVRGVNRVHARPRVRVRVHDNNIPMVVIDRVAPEQPLENPEQTILPILPRRRRRLKRRQRKD